MRPTSGSEPMNDDAAYRQRWYCTYFDSAYAARGRVMLESLRAVGDTAPVVAVCFDEQAAEAVREIPGVRVVSTQELEAVYPPLLTVKAERSRVEYLFTTTPFAMLYALNLAPAGAWVTYLDADLWFLGDPAPIYEEMNTGHAGLIRHDHSPAYSAYERFGIYNVGWVSVRNCCEGPLVAQWWADQCLRWCSDTVSGDRYADQGYLNHFADLCGDLVEITHPGANLAPWNLRQRDVTTDANETVMANGTPVLFMHFHGVRRLRRRYFTADSVYGASANAVVRGRSYRPYVQALAAAGDLRVPPAAKRGRGWRGRWLSTMRWRHYAISYLKGDSYRV